MFNVTRRAWLALSAPIAGAVLAWSTRDTLPDPLALGKAATPRELAQRRHLPNVTLRTHEGRSVRFYDDLVKDKIVAINFFLTSCPDGYCPLTSANLKRVAAILGDRMGRDVFMYSITLEPERDTVPVLANYAREFGGMPGRTFLTGARADIEHLRKSIGFRWPDPGVDAEPDNHTGKVRYINEKYMWWGAVPSLGNPAWIARSILFADWPGSKPKPCC